jgi:hypothetical protein
MDRGFNSCHDYVHATGKPDKWCGREVEADDDASIREPVDVLHFLIHRPQPLPLVSGVLA